MFKQIIGLLLGTTLLATTLSAATVPINGIVQSRCVIQTDNAGTYGNPNAYTLSTEVTDGGEPAIVRFDVSLANAYYATITTPTSFSDVPSLFPKGL